MAFHPVGVTVHLVISAVVEVGRVIDGVDLYIAIGNLKDMVVTVRGVDSRKRSKT